MFLQTPKKESASGSLNHSLLMRTAGKTQTHELLETRSTVKSQVGSQAMKKSQYSKSFGELKYNTMQRPKQDQLSEIEEGDQWAEITKF